MSNKYAVVGLGIFGNSIARTLAQRGAEVLAIDWDEDKVEAIKDEVAYAVAMDSTDMKALIAQNIQDMDAVVVAIGENFEALLITTTILLELNIKRIIARAANKQQRMILEKIGVHEILSPEGEVGKTVAERLLHPNIKTFLSLPDDYEIVEINTPKGIANRSIQNIKLREKYNLNLITIRRKFEEVINGKNMLVEHIIGVPKADTVIFPSDILILIGKTQDVKKFVAVNR
ncbi:MAG: TrkA family potassium uptake protein [Hymenobacteraceae bacterium]|nr:TrkA family potassium uptake protein [Hymenobacteraceae bacterium]MDX5397940.1 TrkA family potassium uptake protein [Hymenobacteraceae bacterium]MDX5443966.1 TrkA family potassium uptake protein [Hymenobacteraceae bacterium]MDX5514011.1 TrkA family potassium uptake protein [Hymenobacteraceae bacterium]